MMPMLSLWGEGVHRVYMDSDNPQAIPMHHSVTLTIQFPYEISALNGAGFSPDLTKAAGEYLISYTAPNNFFSLYPITDDPKSRNLNVIVREKIYVLRPYLVSDPGKAWKALVFEDPDKKRPLDDVHPRVHKSFKQTPKVIQTSSTSKIVAMIDKTKLLSQVSESVLKDLLSVMPEMSISLRKNNVSHYETHRIFLDIVSRNKKYDILVFGVRVINDSLETLVLNPESFTVRCGDHVYTQVLSDFQGTVAPGESAIGYFAIIGTAEGLPNYLATENEFQINLDLLEPSHV